MRHATGQSGFTLIELMITLAILSIVTTLAVGGYREYLRRAGRVDATGALLRIASAQEKFYIQKGQYAGNAELAPPPPNGLGIDTTERGYYQLKIDPAAGGLGAGYTATATVDTASNQQDDVKCWEFSITERGVRSAAERGAGPSVQATERCWR